MRTIEHAGASLRYDDAGRGRPLLLLHAFPLNASMWQPQLDGLNGSCRVIAPDARGFGESRPAPEALTMDQIADDAAAVLDAAGIERAVVCGLSMGGYAAFSFWRRHRERVRALVLADTRAGADSEEGKAEREKFARGALEHGIDWVAAEMLPKLQRAVPDRSVEEQLRGMILTNAVDAVAAAQRGMALRSDSTPLLPTIDCPCLVIVGAQDSLTGPEQAQAMADAIPGCSLSVLQGAGHATNLEAVPAFNAALATFVDRVG